MAHPCQAEDSDGEECDCADFAPKTQDPKTCRRCLHKRKHHPDAGKTETVTSILSKVKADHDARAGSPLVPFSLSSSAKISQAKVESLKGMRPKRHSMVPKDGKSVSRSQGKSKSGREPVAAATFKVDGIVLLTQGLKSIYKGETRVLVLADDSIPNKADISTLVNQGLAVTSSNFEIPLSATHEDIVDLLSDLLSGPMRYFERVGLTVFTDSTGAAVISAPPWCLLTRVRQHLEIVQVVNPTGQDFFNHRGKAAEDRIIFLSSREPIPSDEKIPWRSIESLAFTMPCRAGSEESGNDGVDDTPKPKRKTKKAKGNKRLSSIAFDDSDEGEDSGSQIESIAKRRSTRRHVSDIDSALLPSIFTDSLAQEIGGSDNAVAGPSSHNTNAVAGPSRLSDPIDLTRSPSPEMPSFKWRQVTPESQFIGALDAPDSDPVDYYTYTSGPRPLRKFF